MERFLGLVSEPAQTRPKARLLPIYIPDVLNHHGSFKTLPKLSQELETLSNFFQKLLINHKIKKRTHPYSSMADHGTGGGEGEVIDQSEDRGGPMAVEEVGRTAAEPAGVEGVVLTSGGDGEQGHGQEAAGGENPRGVESETRARDQAGVVEPNREPEGSGMMAEGPPVVEGVSGGAGGSGAVGDKTGLSGSPPRDSAKGKGAVIAEEQVEEVHIEEVRTTKADPVEVREEDIAFRPPAGAATSSRHVPITYDDIAEHTPDEILARVLEQHPEIGEYILKAKEDRARVIEAAEAAARAEREAERERAGPEGLAADVEAEEREAEEALGPRVSAVAEAGALERPEFSEIHASAASPVRTVRAEQRDIRGFGGPCSSLALYIGLPARVRELVDAADFREFILTLTVPVRNDHAVLVALAERWRDTSNTFHLPLGEMMVTPSHFTAITGLRVGGEPIPFDSGIHADPAALEWFLGRGSTVHLSYLPALRDLRTASRFDWGGAALDTAYQFFGDASRNGQSMAGYWRVWELWAYEVLRMYPPECKHPDLSTLLRALIWSKEYRGTKEGRGSLNAYRLYLDELRASQVEWNPWRTSGPEPEYLAQSRAVTASRVLLESAFGWQWYLGDRVVRQSLGLPEFQVPGPLPPRASHTGDYTLAELERFTRPDTELVRHLRPTMDYAAYQRDRLARPLGVRARREIQEQAREAGAERRAAAEVQRGGERRVRRRESRPVVGGPPELVWKVDVVDHQGNTAEVELVPALREPAAVTVQVPAEWVNEALRRMLALENLVRRAAQGMPLQLRYPAPAAQPAQAAASRRTQAQGRAASRKRARSPPQQAATGTTTRPVVTRRQTRSSQPTAASKEAAKKAVARAEERYRIEMREVRGREELVRKRLVVPDPVEDEEEGDEESKSDSDDTVDDPRYLQNPYELAAADEDDSDDDNGGDDVEEDLRDTDWLGRDEDD
ncbi:hypothetical protein RHMOL_Rhmol11G0054100 [Rhododendron molle]|uniref:Uncharacterized protein n=1 Tax=Rhododendron molle TaxID=49168 RepID=A0ACC0LP37_RHOML|nr:hypothetical protein RHMOL_Rhmol11G0054100 [Rhododendron molle]